MDENGKVTAVYEGTAIIKAEAVDGSETYASCQVTVKGLPVSSIVLSKTSLYMYRKYSDVIETLTATVLPSNASNQSLSWSSSNPSVATVSSLGVVTGKANGTAWITVTANDGSGVTASCMVVVQQYVTSITLSKTSLSLVIGEEETLSVTSVLPDNANDKTYTWSSSDNTIASVDQNGKITAKAKGNTVIKATANDGSGVFASCAVSVKEPYTAVAGEAVDLGLSVKWSSMNLGATSPTGYGDYFAWGETETKDNYSWATYKFGTSSSGPFSKYNTKSSCGTVDNKTVLETGPNGDDVASKVLGGKWRIPTDAEWAELINNCTWTWVENYNGSGVNGNLVTASNGNSIFLPAAGNRYGTNLGIGGSDGLYWSSSLNTGCPEWAWFVFFYFDDVRRCDDNDRCFGQSVRPVSE